MNIQPTPLTGSWTDISPELAHRMEVTLSAMENGYTDLVWRDDILCGLQRMLFTTGIIVDIGIWSYSHRLCYDTETHARAALQNWRVGDPVGEGFITLKGLPFETLWEE